MDLPGRAMLVPALFGVAMLAAGSAQAGGVDDVAAEAEVCPPGLTLNDPSMTAEMIRNFWAVRAMSGCRREFIDRATGLPLSEEEKLARVFNRSRIPAAREPSPVPLPGAVWAVVVAGVLAAVGRRAA